jgi:hypothetical protein
MANQYEQAGFQGLGMQGAQTVSSAPNVDYGLTKRYVDTSTALNDRAYDAQAAIDEAEMLRQHKISDFMDEQNARQAEAMTDMRARQFVQEEADMQAQERTKQAYGLVSQATEKLMSAGGVDPGRWWASRTDGQKVAAFFGMLGRGMGGGNPSDFLNERIDRDVAAQEATFAQGVAAAGAARQQGDMARAMYADIRASTQDKREADAVYAAARAEQMKAQFEALAVRSAIPSVMAQQQQNRLAIEQMVADRRMTLEKIAAHNAKQRTVVSQAYRAVRDPATGQVYRVPVGGPGDVTLAKYALEEASKSRGDARKVLGDTVTEGIKAGAKNEEADRAERKFQYEMRKDQAGGEKGAAVETALQLAQDWMKDYGEDVPDRTEGGIGGTAYLSAPKWLSSKEGRRELSRRQNIGHWFATALTGATVSDAQKEFVDGLVAGENMSGDDLRMGIQDLTRTLQVYQSTYQRSAEEAAQAGYRGVDQGQLPTRDPKTGGLTRSNTGVDAEAAKLGGTLR